jgi:membrane-bound ClpP family serine protease
MTQTFVTKKGNSKMSLFLGAVFTIQGILFLVRDILSPYGNTIGIFLLIYGVANILLSYFGFSESSKISPKIIVSEEGISIKKSIFSNTDSFHWKEVKSLSLRENKMELETMLDNKKIALTDYNPDLKLLLIQLASQKNIPLTSQ